MKSAVTKGRFALFVLLLGAIALAAAAWGWYSFRVAPLPFPDTSIRLTVPSGATVRTVAQQLRAQGVDVSPTRLWLWYRIRGHDGKLKAGTYALEAPMTVDGLLDRIVRGDVLLVDVRFIEGWTFRQMREAIDAHPDLVHETRSMSVTELLQRIGATEAHPEGLFFPDTYRFSPGTRDLEIFRKAYEAQKRTLQAAWEGRAAELPYRDPYEALVMASIVEKETGLANERDKVAGVFVNRLRRGMMLQSDPTTIYGLGERFDGNLRKRDLQADTAYNTYTRAGLPPTPIALPGRESIEAALHPADIRSLYFVSRGDGTSEFSDDLDSHNRAVSRYQRGGR